jgi:hypothetical protein
MIQAAEKMNGMRFDFEFGCEIQPLKKFVEVAAVEAQDLKYKFKQKS